MSEKELLCESLDNSLNIPEEQHNTSLSHDVGVKCSKIDHAVIPKSKDDDTVSSDGPMTESYAEIFLEDDLLQNSNSELEPVNTSLILENGPKSHRSNADGESEENSERDEDIMTGSYGEISLDRDLPNCDKSDSQSSNKEEILSDDIPVDYTNDLPHTKRPDSLVFTQSLLDVKNEGSVPTQVDKSQQTSADPASSKDFSQTLSSAELPHTSGHTSNPSGLSDLQGTLVMDGDMVTFVAEDLQEKIKMSSPVSQWEDSTFPRSRSSTPSLYRQALQPSQHIIDPNIIVDLEEQAKKVATCIDVMLENLSGTLQSISSLTVDCMETYENSVCKTCDAVDMNIKAVYQLMAKCEELGNSMCPLYKISGDIKHIKKMLDLLEHTVEHKS